MKELLLVGIAAGVGGLVLGRWGQPIEAKIVAMGIPAPVEHFSLVAASAVAVYWLGRKAL